MNGKELGVENSDRLAEVRSGARLLSDKLRLRDGRGARLLPNRDSQWYPSQRGSSPSI